MLSAKAASGEPLGVVLRMAAIYGPRMNGNYVSLANALARGHFLPVGDGSNLRTSAYYRNAVKAAIPVFQFPFDTGLATHGRPGVELGDLEGVLVIDESGFPEQGRHSVGVARQYCGTLSKIANCQFGVFLGYANSKGHVGLDRTLFVPREWTEDPDGRRGAGIPERLTYRTKPELALEMIQRALDAGLPAAWVVADEVYGSDGKLHRALEERGQAYALAVRSSEATTAWSPCGLPAQLRVGDLAISLGDDEQESCNTTRINLAQCQENRIEGVALFSVPACSIRRSPHTKAAPSSLLCLDLSTCRVEPAATNAGVQSESNEDRSNRDSAICIAEDHPASKGANLR